jgi:hypothetical protein
VEFVTEYPFSKDDVSTGRGRNKGPTVVCGYGIVLLPTAEPGNKHKGGLVLSKTVKSKKKCTKCIGFLGACSKNMYHRLYPHYTLADPKFSSSLDVL